ncbi:unnamed protein product [Gongylonema pulchrum]|uniref:Uncharacterized protein n=1 Tax=Gongylonema pulchrum TaxID=637853 RepID=A0A183EJT6_9BILA|nr:unnamed protein product [Gongylonema pulchrum]
MSQKRMIPLPFPIMYTAATFVLNFYLFDDSTRHARSLTRIGAFPSETVVTEGSTAAAAAAAATTGAAATTATTSSWMNDTGISVCPTAAAAAVSAVSTATPNNVLKRPSDFLIDGVAYEKRLKVEPIQEDHKFVFYAFLHLIMQVQEHVLSRSYFCIHT